ncbi:hypothetical protein ABPG75_001349 [Micractinium tetrahymenae]
MPSLSKRFFIICGRMTAFPRPEPMVRMICDSCLCAVRLASCVPAGAGPRWQWRSSESARLPLKQWYFLQPVPLEGKFAPVPSCLISGSWAVFASLATACLAAVARLKHLTLPLARMQDVQTARQLLELGADPNAGHETALTALPDNIRKGHVSPALRQLLALLLQHGADCLHLGSARQSSCLLKHLSGGLASALLAHLERQRQAGTLPLGSKDAATVLAMGAMRAGHAQLLAHALARLEQLFAAPPAFWWEGEDEADRLSQLLALSLDLAGPRVMPALRALLASQLAFDVTCCWGCSPLARAAQGGAREASVPLLLQAGAEVTLADLLVPVQRPCPAGVAELLSHAAPPVDAATPAMAVWHTTSYSCPIHRLLQQMVRLPAACCLPCSLASPHPQVGRRCSMQPTWLLRSVAPPPPAQDHRSWWWSARRTWEGLRVLELLLEAGHRPTVYRNTAPPPFLNRGSAVLPLFDPFDLYSEHLDKRLVLLARGGAWTPTSHDLWPPAFKAATRTLLLAGSAAGAQPVAEPAGGSKRRRRGRGVDPAGRTRGSWLALLPQCSCACWSLRQCP